MNRPLYQFIRMHMMKVSVYTSHGNKQSVKRLIMTIIFLVVASVVFSPLFSTATAWTIRTEYWAFMVPITVLSSERTLAMKQESPERPVTCVSGATTSTFTQEPTLAVRLSSPSSQLQGLFTISIMHILLPMHFTVALPVTGRFMAGPMQTVRGVGCPCTFNQTQDHTAIAYC